MGLRLNRLKPHVSAKMGCGAATGRRCDQAALPRGADAGGPAAPRPDGRSVGRGWEPSLTFGANGVGLKPGQQASGTETMHLEAHKGELFASFGRWMSRDFVKKDWPNMKPFIARVESAGGRWVVDMQAQGSSRYAPRMTCLKSVTFARDRHGKDLGAPVQQLVACFGLGGHGNFMLFRDDADGGAGGEQHRWHEVKYTAKCADPAGDAARAVIVHRDAVTGVDRIFALQGVRGALSGAYDPSSGAPGRVVWNEQPERLDLGSVKAKALPFRPLALAVANGKLYMSSAGWVLQRVDGPEPHWKVVVDVTSLRPTDGKLMQAVGGIRGLSAVPAPGGSGSSLLFCWNPNASSRSWILRADFEQGEDSPKVVEETAITQLAKHYLGQGTLSYTLAAYNDIMEAPWGDGTCHLIGFETVVHGAGMKSVPLDPRQTSAKHGFWAGGGFVVRKGAGDFEVMEVGGPRSSPAQADPALTAVRCYKNSPFPEEAGTVYFGGYDCNSFPSDDTAWIYKGRLR
uniref:Uncharacterized protein n=1 Tax=Alexandrium monilatum TaxID=311494 RepID=A0A7S4U9Z5_9DINO